MSDVVSTTSSPQSSRHRSAERAQRSLNALVRLMRSSGVTAVARWLLPRRIAIRLNVLVIARMRRKYAQQYLAGDGLEIGAMHLPLAVPPGVRVRYVDRCSREEAIVSFPELDAAAIVRPDIVDDGFTLSSIPPESQRFVVANHVLEHASNPLLVLQRWWQLLAPAGVLFVTVPLHDRSFDRGRALTAVAHIVEDFDVARRDGPQALARRNVEHYAEWVSIAEPQMAGKARRRADAASAARAAELAAQNVEIHFHTFSVCSFGDLVRAFAERPATRSRVLEVVELKDEVLAVLQKERPVAEA